MPYSPKPPNLTSSLSSTELVRALRELLGNLNPNFFLTMEFGGEIKLDAAKRHLNNFFYKIERNLNNDSYFYRLSPELRISGLVFVEHLDSNLHFHSLTTVPTRADKFVRNAQTKWASVVNRGSIEVVKILSLNDHLRTSSYSTKEAYKQINYNNFFFIEELRMSVSLQSPSRSKLFL